MDLEILDSYLNDENMASIEMLKEIGETKNRSAIPILLRHYETINNHAIRLNIAFALSDMRCKEMIEPTIRLIIRPDVKERNG